MTLYIINLIRDFITSSASTINNFFKDLYWFVFYIEEQFINNNGSYVLNFDEIYKVIYSWALILLIIMFIKKMIQTYFLYKSGEEDQSPIRVIIGLLEAIIVMIAFGWLYNFVIEIGYDFYTSILKSGSIDDFDINSLSSTVGGGLFSAIVCIILVWQFLVMMWQFIRRGIEILIMRCILPITTIGLLNSNGGAFSIIIKKLGQNLFTVILQLILMYLVIQLTKAQHYIYAIACAMLATSTPEFLQEFLVAVGGVGIGGMINKGTSFMHHAGGAARSARNIIAKPIQGAVNNYNIGKNAIEIANKKAQIGNGKGGTLLTGAKAVGGAMLKETLGGYNSGAIRDRQERALNNIDNRINSYSNNSSSKIDGNIDKKEG